MYRSHCQRVLDTFVVANSEDVHKYVSHFWSGIPQHLTELLDNQFMANVIECADSVLYSVSDLLLDYSVLIIRKIVILWEKMSKEKVLLTKNS